MCNSNSAAQIYNNFLPIEKAAHNAIKPGVISLFHLNGDKRKKYYVYVPLSKTKHNAIFATIHGISRNAFEHAKYFANYAEYYGVTLVSPLFDRDLFSNYQKLGQTSSEQRADKFFNDVIAEAAYLTGSSANKLFLFGFSGGGQFAHRYMMAYPGRVASIAIGAAGWYTMPDAAQPFPFGIQPSEKWLDLNFDSKKFLTIPALVLVGERDIRRDRALRKTKKLDKLQGKTRLERGFTWICAMKTAALKQGLKTRYQFVQLPRCGHSFSKCAKQSNMAQQIFQHFFNY